MSLHSQQCCIVVLSRHRSYKITESEDQTRLNIHAGLIISLFVTNIEACRIKRDQPAADGQQTDQMCVNAADTKDRTCCKK